MFFRRWDNSKEQMLSSFDMLQVKDYSRFSMTGFNADHK